MALSAIGVMDGQTTNVTFSAIHNSPTGEVHGKGIYIDVPRFEQFVLIEVPINQFRFMEMHFNLFFPELTGELGASKVLAPMYLLGLLLIWVALILG